MEQVQVGKIKSAHGIRGELYVLIFSGEISWLDSLDRLQFQDDQGQQHEFSSFSVRPQKQGFIFKVNGIETRSQAEKLKGWSFFIPVSYLTSGVGENIYLREIIGFEVFSSGQALGCVVGFSGSAAQDLIELQNGALIPLVESFIQDIDWQQRRLHLELPEGLIEAQTDGKSEG